MKFKFKMLIVNIIGLSIAMSITGYLMIHMNFSLALNALVDSAISENNLAQTYVEYDLLEFINNNGKSVCDELKTIGNNIGSGTLMTSSLYIYYDGAMISSDDSSVAIPPDLLNISEKVSKKYILCQENDTHYIYVSSCNEINNAYLHIITKKSVENAYSLMAGQLRFFQLLFICILALGGIFIFILSTILTHPLARLNRISDEIANGNYSMRAPVSSSDEVGQLAAKFNHMAASVESHVNDLQQQVYRREQFVADFTHEIKTPLTTIIGYADTMRSMDLPREDQTTFLSYIVASGKRLEIMSQKLFELIYLNRHDIEAASINIASLCNQIKEYILPSLKEKSLTLEIDVEDANIYGNRELLITAFTNLLDNARKASSEGSKILLRGTISNDSYTLSVIDYGIGIAKEHLDKICDEFYMVDKSRSRKEGSAGLGLSLTALIIKRHNGKITIESTEGEGTVFHITLPLFKKDHEKHEEN